MHTLKNIILTLCIISFFSLSPIEKISNASYIPSHKQANIAFVGFINSGKTGLRARLVGIPFDFDGMELFTIRDQVFPSGLMIDDDDGHECAIDCRLWDTCCHPSHKDRTINSICKYMDIVVITVDLVRPNWKQEICRNVLEWQREILEINPNVKIILACTKSDLISDPAQLRDIEKAVNNFTDADQALGGSVRGVVLSAKTEHKLDTLMQIIKDDLREIGLDNLRDIHEKLPCESSGGCLLL